jgi:hypothetical protein
MTEIVAFRRYSVTGLSLRFALFAALLVATGCGIGSRNDSSIYFKKESLTKFFHAGVTKADVIAHFGPPSSDSDWGPGRKGLTYIVLPSGKPLPPLKDDEVIGFEVVWKNGQFEQWSPILN